MRFFSSSHLPRKIWDEKFEMQNKSEYKDNEGDSEKKKGEKILIFD